ncbi:MAG: MmgE/PrpD family protein [Alphaproteobacteria bacterium]|nr:MmgE/PrpD family protein [Alphaproteobacteria bacterium]
MHRRNVLRLAGGAALAAGAARVGNAESARPLAERLADYADRLHYEDLDAATIERVKAHLIDTLGCGIAALDEPVVRICRDVALLSGAGDATVIDAKQRSSAELASFANGAACRYYDLNDNYATASFGTVHPSDHISACLAVAETERATTHDLILAIALAYEVNCRLLDASDAATRGWDLPLFSLPAVALAAGKLMKLTPAQLAQAVNLALNDHIPMGQTRTQVNSDWKGLADAEAGRNAIFAAQLARRGLTGPAPIFEGRKGFFALVSSPAEIDVGAFGGRIAQFKIHKCGMKPYPAVVYSQTAIVAALAAAKEIADLNAITAIEIATTRRGYEQAGRDPEKWTPHNRDTADHSLPYITARAMLDGDIHNGSYTAEKLAEPRVVALMRKTTVKEDPAFAKPKGNAPSTRLTVTLTDGKQVVREVNDMPGFPGQPMSRADIERKFRGNATRWPKERVDTLLQNAWALEADEDLSALLGQLA